MKSLHKKDFHAWCFEQSNALLLKKDSEIDFKNLAQEIKAMGDSEEDNLENRMIILFEHILKCLYQKERRTGSWDGSIEEQRYRINKKLRQCPSLNPLVDQLAVDAYPISVIRVQKKNPHLKGKLPKEMPFTFKEAMEKEF